MLSVRGLTTKKLQANGRVVFIPNNDINPNRRMRIRKAVEYGAEWVQVWSSNVTHIVVDKAITKEDVLKFLKISIFSVSIMSEKRLALFRRSAN